MNEDQRKAWRNVGLKHDAPFGLPEVINAVEQNVLNICSHSDNDDYGDEDQEPGVILIGHSLGAYIALEVIQRHRLRLESLSKVVGEPRVVGVIGLFPTVIDIGKSQKGKVLTVCDFLFFSSVPWRYGFRIVIQLQRCLYSLLKGD